MQIELDGAQGEGGGQILRSALSLSMCTGQAFTINRIRAKRKNPGLMRQHLTAVQAATQICSATVEGATVGSQQLCFRPGKITGGQYQFTIGTAGSCTLVLQTILPALLMADSNSQITLSGGTHNSMSPPFHFLQRAFVPLLQQMGATLNISLDRFGFYPAGGGEITADIVATPQLKPLHLATRGEQRLSYAECFFAALPMHVAERELGVVKKRLAWTDAQLIRHEVDRKQGPGNALLLTLEHDHVTEVFVGFGEKGVSAETVAEKVVTEMKRYLSSSAAVAGYLADQLLLPMALAGSGSFTTTTWSQHAASNASVIEQFLPVQIRHDVIEQDKILVTVEAKS